MTSSLQELMSFTRSMSASREGTTRECLHRFLSNFFKYINISKNIFIKKSPNGYKAGKS
jgi:hypothetical protein